MLKTFIRLSISAILLLLVLPFARAQTYPDKRDLYVVDYANVVNSDYYASIRNVLMEFKRRENIEMIVATVTSRDAHGAQNLTMHDFATNTFNAWGIGDASSDKGILLMISVTDREMSIILGTGYSSSLNGEFGPLKPAFDTMRSYFQSSSYGEGLYRGVLETAEIVAGVDLSQPPSSFPTETPTVFETATRGPSPTPGPTSTPAPTATVALIRLPDRVDPYFNSADNSIPERHANAIRTMLKNLAETKNIRMTVLVVSYVEDYISSGSSDVYDFTQRVYHAWDLGGSSPTILIVLASGAGEIRVQQSPEETEFDPVLRNQLETVMRPSWANGDKGQALCLGVHETAQYVTGEPVTDACSGGLENTIAAIGESLKNAAGGLSENPLPLVAVPIVGGGVLGVLFRRWKRYRPRKCESCGGNMVLLDEYADDAHMDEGQRTEEALGSINYDVWECENCGARTMLDYKNWFSGHSECPKCNYRTLSTQSSVVDAATTYSTGLRTVTQICNNPKCDYRKSWEEVIPMRTSSSGGSGHRSSSSGGSRSSGGGKSSGGGASSKW